MRALPGALIAEVSVAELLRAQIARFGPLPVSSFVEAALYGPRGFYASGSGAGRSGKDFITSPETGDLFGKCVANRLDAIWEMWGCPDPFFVVEGGAGRGRLAQSILRAAPRCVAALRYVMVERSDALRSLAATALSVDLPEMVLATRGEELVAPVPGPQITALATLPMGLPNAVVICNELVDNLVFDIEVRAGNDWIPVRVGADGVAFIEVVDSVLSPGVVDRGAEQVHPERRPVLKGWSEWIREVSRIAPNLSLLLFDYGGTEAEIVERSPDWLRTYHGQRKGRSYLCEPGSQDITIDVPFDVLERDLVGVGMREVRWVRQGDWLHAHGIEEIVSEAQAAIPARLDPGDLEQLRLRSVPTEAAALKDPAGLGGFYCLEAHR